MAAAQGLLDSARHVIGCQLNQETRVQNAFDDMASTFPQSLGVGVRDAAQEPHGAHLLVPRVDLRDPPPGHLHRWGLAPVPFAAHLEEPFLRELNSLDLIPRNCAS